MRVLGILFFGSKTSLQSVSERPALVCNLNNAQRRYQCWTHVILCDGSFYSWLEAACWKHLCVLDATVLVSCSQLRRVSQETLRIHQEDEQFCFRFIWHVQSSLPLLFLPCYYWYSKESKDSLTNWMRGLKNNRASLIKLLVRFIQLDLCAILTARSCRLLPGICTFAVPSSIENYSFQQSDFYVELIHAATYRESLPVPLKCLYLTVETGTSISCT